jgi:cysteine desulfurase
LSEDDLRKPSIRISFSYTNTKSDIDALVQALTSVGEPISFGKM